MNIKRYILTIATTGKDDPDGEYTFVQGVGHTDGDWVKWSDVEKLLALRAAEAAEVKAWRNHSEKCKNAIKMGIMAATNAARRAAGVDRRADA